MCPIEEGIPEVVHSTAVKHKNRAPAHRDRLEVRTCARQISACHVEFEHQIWRPHDGDEPFAVLVVVVGYQPCKIPDVVVAQVKVYNNTAPNSDNEHFLDEEDHWGAILDTYECAQMEDDHCALTYFADGIYIIRERNCFGRFIYSTVAKNVEEEEEVAE
jgi:hypothetical protein